MAGKLGQAGSGFHDRERSSQRGRRTALAAVVSRPGLACSGRKATSQEKTKRQEDLCVKNEQSWALALLEFSCVTSWDCFDDAVKVIMGKIIGN